MLVDTFLPALHTDTDMRYHILHLFPFLLPTTTTYKITASYKKNKSYVMRILLASRFACALFLFSFSSQDFFHPYKSISREQITIPW